MFVGETIIRPASFRPQVFFRGRHGPCPRQFTQAKTLPAQLVAEVHEDRTSVMEDGYSRPGNAKALPIHSPKAAPRGKSIADPEALQSWTPGKLRGQILCQGDYKNAIRTKQQVTARVPQNSTRNNDHGFISAVEGRKVRVFRSAKRRTWPRLQEPPRRCNENSKRPQNIAQLSLGVHMRALYCHRTRVAAFQSLVSRLPE